MRSEPRKGSGLRVCNNYGAKRKNSIVHESKEAFEREHGLVPVDDPQVGDKVLHLVRNLAYLRRPGTTGTEFRAALHPCTILRLAPNEVWVRFEKGNIDKKVKKDSLYKRVPPSAEGV